MTTPCSLQSLRAVTLPRGVRLEWTEGEERERPLASKWFIVRLRVDTGGRTSLEKTEFVPATHRVFVDGDLAPGTYRYFVGGLNEAGSGPHRVLDVAVRG